MAKLKGSVSGFGGKRPPALAVSNLSSGRLANTATPKNTSLKALSLLHEDPKVPALSFGTLHTKAQSTSAQSGSQWMGLLSSATGGVSSLLGGGLFSSSGFGFVEKLLSLFGGGHSTPALPTPFQSPLQIQNSISIGSPEASNSVQLGVHPLATNSQMTGIYQQSGTTASNQHVQSSQVIQIVKQAILTSSSLNDVISEI